MTIRWAIVLPLAFGILSSWTATCRAQQDPFSQWDRDGDGRLTREELPPQLRPNFNRVDSDHDGYVSREEHRTVLTRLRESLRQPGQTMQPAGRRVPEGISAKRDIPYADTDNPRQCLDLYLPEKPAGEGPLPVVVWIHGGAWLAGDKSGGVGRVVPYVASGRYAGISVGYRLTGEATWPAQIHDCKAAIRWIRANAEKYGLDPDRIGVWGSSAGGHLVAMLGASGDVKALEGELGDHTDRSSRVSCVADYFGPSELLTMGDFDSTLDHNAPDSPESRLLGGAIRENQDAARAASPISYVTRDDPPFLIVHGTADRTVPFNQSEVLAARLKAAGVDVVFVPVEGGGHGGFPTPEPDKRVRAFFDRHLLGMDVEVSGEAIKAEGRRP